MSQNQLYFLFSDFIHSAFNQSLALKLIGPRCHVVFGTKSQKLLLSVVVPECTAVEEETAAVCHTYCAKLRLIQHRCKHVHNCSIRSIISLQRMKSYQQI